MLSSRFIKVRHGRGAHRLQGSRVLPADRPQLHGDAAVVDGAPRVVVIVCVLVIASIVPLFQAIGKGFTPTDDRSRVPGDCQGAGRIGLAATHDRLERIATEFAAASRGRDTLTTVGGAPAAAWPRRWAGECAERQRRIDPCDAPATSQRGLAGRGHGPCPRGLRQYPSELRTGIQESGGGGGGRASSTRFAGPDLARLAEYSETLARAGAGAADRRRRGFVAGHRQARTAGGNRSSARGRPGDPGPGHRAGAEHAGRRQQVTSFYVGDDQYDVTLRADQRFRSSVDGLARMTISSSRGPVTLGEVVRIEPVIRALAASSA